MSKIITIDPSNKSTPDGPILAGEPNVTLLADVPEKVRRYILKSARLEPSVPNGYLYAYTADVETATRVVASQKSILRRVTGFFLSCLGL